MKKSLISSYSYNYQFFFFFLILHSTQYMFYIINDIITNKYIFIYSNTKFKLTILYNNSD